MFRIFKLGHGKVIDRPISTAAGDVPAAISSTPDTSSHPIVAEVLVQGVDPITAE